MAILVSAVLFTGCAKDGATGPMGPVGLPGPTGPQGGDAPGNITTNTTWTAASSPYLITRNIVVQTGVTLTVQPGTVIKINPGTTIYVDGTLKAQGTSLSHILFDSTSNFDSGSWQLTFSSTSVGNSLRYCQLANLKALGASLDIRYCYVGSMDIRELSFLLCTDNTIPSVWVTEMSSPVVFNNILSSGGYGFHIAGGTYTITGSSIINVDTNAAAVGIYPGIYPNALMVSNCNFYANSYNVAIGDGVNGYNFQGNYWGTTETAEIDSKINGGTIDYSGYLSTAVTAVTGCGW